MDKRPGKRRIKTNILPAAIMTGPITLWLLLLIVIPLVYVFVISFCTVDANYDVVFNFTLKNYKALLDTSYMEIYLNSLIVAFITTALCLLLGYPFAYLIARVKSSKKVILYMIVIIPFWTNSLIRIYGWRTILGTQGLFNQILTGLHLIDTPVEFLFTRGAVILGMVYTLFPFMVLPLYTAIEKLDNTLLEASSDLGAKGKTTLMKVILPLTASGIFSGAIMVFIPTLGFFFVADILGGGNSAMIGNLIERQFQGGNNWPMGAALSIILIVITLLLVKLYQKMGGDMESLGV